jgi:ABC-type branched-subunit amino acid transport system permease subunit
MVLSVSRQRDAITRYGRQSGNARCQVQELTARKFHRSPPITANRHHLHQFALLSYLLLDQLIRSPIGETLTAIREDEVSAASLGINCGAWKVFAFGVGSAVAGAAGCFYASFVGTLVPDAFFVTESFAILAMVIVGEMGTLIGPVCGAILLTMLPEFLRGIGDLRLVVYGVAVTLVVLFIPGGIVQAAQLGFERLRRAARQETQ